MPTDPAPGFGVTATTPARSPVVLPAAAAADVPPNLDGERDPGCARGGGGWRRVLRTPTPVIFALSVAVAALLLWRQGSLGELGSALRRARPEEVVAGFALYAAGLVLLCGRWQALVRMVGGTARFGVAAEAFLTSVVVNYAAPIGLAIPARALLSVRDLRLSPAAGGAVALWEVGLDLLLLGGVSLAWLLTGGLGRLGPWWGRIPAAAVPIGAALLGALGLLVVGLGRWRPVLAARVGQRGREALAYPLRRPREAGLAALLTVGFWVLQAVILRLLLGAVGAGAVGWVAVAGLLGPPVLLGMVSPVPGGAGVRETLMVAVAQASGLDGTTVLVAAVAYRVALFAAIPVVYAAVRAWGAGRGGRRAGAERRGTGG